MTTTTTYNGKKLYKVLLKGKSCHGGNMEWSLPTQNADGTWTPGDWHEVVGEPSMCSHGLHLTTDPVRWFKSADQEVYEVEAEDFGGYSAEGEKIVCRKSRLLARVTDAAVLLALHIATCGAVDVRADFWVAYGNSTVTANGNSTVRAYGSSTVTANGNSTVTACDSSTVTACDSSTVTACDSSTVTATGTSNLISIRYLWQSAIEAQKAVRKVSGQAVHIDRRGDYPVIKYAGDSGCKSQRIKRAAKKGKAQK